MEVQRLLQRFATLSALKATSPVQQDLPRERRRISHCRPMALRNSAASASRSSGLSTLRQTCLHRARFPKQTSSRLAVGDRTFCVVKEPHEAPLTGCGRARFGQERTGRSCANLADQGAPGKLGPSRKPRTIPMFGVSGFRQPPVPAANERNTARRTTTFMPVLDMPTCLAATHDGPQPRWVRAVGGQSPPFAGQRRCQQPLSFACRPVGVRARC